MHGTEHCNPERRAHYPSASPVSDFAVTGSKLPDALQLSPDRGWTLVTAFRSPATAAAYTASIPRSMFLACYFASAPADSATRSVFDSATDQRFAPRPAASTPQTRCSFVDQLDLPHPRPPLPVRTVTSLRIKAFCRTCRSSTRLPIPPDLRSLPAAGLYC